MNIDELHTPDRNPEAFPPQSPEAENAQPDNPGDLPSSDPIDPLLPLQLDTKTPEHPEPREEMVTEAGDRIEDEPPEQLVAEESISPSPISDEEGLDSIQSRIEQLRSLEQSLETQVQHLHQEAEALQRQIEEQQSAMGQLVQAGLSELEHRKHKLEITIEKLERRADRIRTEMRTSFAGVSQDLAIRVQGFKDYLVGSLQDLASTAENIELGSAPVEEERAYRQSEPTSMRPRRESSRERTDGTPSPQFAQQKFSDQVRKIRHLVDQYRTRPDYYGPAWQLRRTFEPIHAERVSNWFFAQGGRGAIRSMGSRLQNILVASAIISIVYSLYGDRLRPLILVNTPERLGEWRRGLQDCLGISRADFSSESGIAMFEAPEPLAAKAERITQQKQLPLIIIDESEDKVSVSMLQFPLWLAFAPNPEGPPAIDNW